MIRKNKGQSSVEALLSIVGSFFVFSFIAFFCLVYFLEVWVDHNSYEAAICIHSYPHPIEDCQQKFKDQLAALWPLGELKLQYEKKNLQKLKETFCL